jgi:hypothetical protein
MDQDMTYEQVNSFTPQNVLTLAERVLALDEPWRSRFLTVIAGQEPASGWKDGHPRRFPSPVEVALWLCDPGAYRRVGRMVRTWTHTI